MVRARRASPFAVRFELETERLDSVTIDHHLVHD
jgi:hypothetical protein